MRARLLQLALVPLAVLLLTGASGCGGDSSGGGTTQQQATVGEQSYGGFPGAGSPTAPNVTTTPGKAARPEPGQAGGGSSATCVGC